MNPRTYFLPIIAALLAGGSLALAQTKYNELPLTYVPSFGTISAHGLSELDSGNADDFGDPGYCYVAGSCSVYPLIFQTGLQSLGAAAWTTVPVMDDLNDATGDSGVLFPSIHSPAAQLPPLFPKGVNHSAGYANAVSVALTGVAAAPSVRVGYTPLHFAAPPDAVNALRFQATSWVANGTGGYTPNNLDPTSIYVSSRATSVAQGDNGVDLACGYGYTANAAGLTRQEFPLFWSLNANGTVPAGGGPIAVPTLGNDAYPYAIDTRTDGGSKVTFVGEGIATIPAQPINSIPKAVTSKWALFWRETYPGAANTAPLNLNDPSVVDSGDVPTPGTSKVGQCVGGTALAVAYYTGQGGCAGNKIDIIVGQVTIKASYVVRGRTYYTTVKKAYVWFYDGANWAGNFVIPNDQATATTAPDLKNSVARGVSIVNGAPMIVGAMQTGNNNAWSGFIATAPNTCNLNVWATQNVQLDVNSTPANRWSVVDIMGINQAGVMIATEKLSRSWTYRDVVLVPNPNNFNYNLLYLDFLFDVSPYGFANSIPPNL